MKFHTLLAMGSLLTGAAVGTPTPDPEETGIIQCHWYSEKETSEFSLTDVSKRTQLATTANLHLMNRFRTQPSRIANKSRLKAQESKARRRTYTTRTDQMVMGASKHSGVRYSSIIT